jgi:hypothetical protein
MQHEHPPGGAPSPLEHSAVLRALWPSLCTHHQLHGAGASPGQLASAFPATVARLDGVHTLSLRSMACLRRLLLVAPSQPAGAVFPRLQSPPPHGGGCTQQALSPCMHA